MWIVRILLLTRSVDTASVECAFALHSTVLVEQCRHSRFLLNTLVGSTRSLFNPAVVSYW